VTAYVEGLGVTVSAHNELLDLIYRHAAVSGIRLAPAKDRPLPAPESREPASPSPSAPERVLGIVPLFAALTHEEREAIAKKLKQEVHERGEVVVTEETVLSSLFIVGRGVLSVTSFAGGIEREPLRFGPGDHYGEVGMLTGSPAGANITALATTTVFELAKADLMPILEARPQIAHELSQALAERQAAGRALATASEPGRGPLHAGLSNWFLVRIHRLLEVEASS